MIKIEFDTNTDAFVREDGNGLETETFEIFLKIMDNLWHGKYEGLIHDTKGNHIGYYMCNEQER